MLRLMLAFSLIACGGKKSAPATTTTATPTTTAQPEGSGHMDEHEGMPPELAKFHEVLAPRWHAEKGPKRMKDTCAALPEMQTDANAIAKATPPKSTNADTWTKGTRALLDGLSMLDASCKANDSVKFEASFERVHNAFENLAAAAGEHHDEHEHKM